MTSIDRRRFGSLVAGFTVAPALGADAQAAPGESREPEVVPLSRNGWMPNNEHLPLLLYRGAIATGSTDTADRAAARFEAAFTRNGWPPQWRNGVYTFHHYHSTAHEVLGFAAGSARIVFGGEGGHELTVRAGDVAILPAGTGHCEIEASGDLLVIGAYPPGQTWDICRSAPDAAAIGRMRGLPFPKSDPVSGAQGPLTRLWAAEKS